MTSGPGPWRRLRSHRRLRPARAKVLGSKASTEPSFAFLSARSSHASLSRNDHRGTCTWATENRRRFSKVLVLQVSPRARPSCAEPTFLSCSRTAMRCAYPPARLLQPPRRHLMRCRPILPCGKTPHRQSAASLRRDDWRGRLRIPMMPAGDSVRDRLCVKSARHTAADRVGSRLAGLRLACTCCARGWLLIRWELALPFEQGRRRTQRGTQNKGIL